MYTRLDGRVSIIRSYLDSEAPTLLLWACVLSADLPTLLLDAADRMRPIWKSVAVHSTEEIHNALLTSDRQVRPFRQTLISFRIVSVYLYMSVMSYGCSL